MTGISSSLPVGHRIAGAVLSKAKDQMEANGKAALSLLESAAQSAPRPMPGHKGQNINISA